MEKDFSGGRQCAFTLIELLVATAVVVFMVAVAAPRFSGLLVENRRVIAVNELISSMRFARSEAILRGHKVSLCKSADGTDCSTGNDWNKGWIVFSDAENVGVRDAGETVIRRFEGLPGFRIYGNTFLASTLTYTPLGFTESPTGGLGMGSIWVCPNETEISGTKIVIARRGRIRTESTECEQAP